MRPNCCDEEYVTCGVTALATGWCSVSGRHDDGNLDRSTTGLVSSGEMAWESTYCDEDASTRHDLWNKLWGVIGVFSRPWERGDGNNQQAVQ